MDRAVRIAIGLFHERGYAGVGVAELSRAMDVQPPSLYAAFGSKLGLLERALETYSAESTFVRDALAGPGSAVDALGRMFEAASTHYTKDETRRGCLVLDGTRNCSEPSARALTRALVQATHAAIDARVRPDHPETAEVVADYALTTLRGMSAAARDGASAATLRTVADVATAGVRATLESTR